MKKIICCLLSLVMICTAFSACSKSGDKEETSEAQSVNMKYTFDSAYDSYDQSSVDAYKSLCDAVVNYKSELRINTGMLDDVLQLFNTSFPLSALVKDIQNKSDNSGVAISYKFDKTQHDAKVKAFNDKVNEIITKCSAGETNKGIFTIKVYNYIASSIKLSDNEAVTCLDTVLNGSGSSFSYTQLFEYVLRQKDIKTYHVLASDAIGKGWGVSGAVIYDNLYYFDLMSEYYDNQGQKLKFFGMTNDDLADEGLKNLKLTDQNNAPEATDLKFDTLRKCDKWELNGTKLLVTLKSDDVVEIAL